MGVANTSESRVRVEGEESEFIDDRLCPFWSNAVDGSSVDIAPSTRCCNVPRGASRQSSKDVAVRRNFNTTCATARKNSRPLTAKSAVSFACSSSRDWRVLPLAEGR